MTPTEKQIEAWKAKAAVLRARGKNNTLHDIEQAADYLDAAALSAALAVEADAAEAERDEANTFLDRERGFVSHQAETISSLTEQLAEARAREAEALVALKPLAYLLDAVELMGGPSRLTRDDDPLYQCHSSVVGNRSITLGDMKLARATLSRLEKQEGEA